MNQALVQKDVSLTSIESIIYDLIASEAVRFDIHIGGLSWSPINFLRLTSTRELITDEIRDKILGSWSQALKILSQEESIKNRFDFSTIKGLCITQSDYGFDPHTLEFREDHNTNGYYRW